MNPVFIWTLVVTSLFVVSPGSAYADWFSEDNAGMWGTKWGMPISEATRAYEIKKRRSLLVDQPYYGSTRGWHYKKASNPSGDLFLAKPQYKDVCYSSKRFAVFTKDTYHYLCFIGGRLRYAGSSTKFFSSEFQEANTHYKKSLEQMKNHYGEIYEDTSGAGLDVTNNVRNRLKALITLRRERNIKSGAKFLRLKWPNVHNGQTNGFLMFFRSGSNLYVETFYEPKDSVAAQIDRDREALNNQGGDEI